MTTKVFIDGKEGTTGLQIFERFKDRKDIEILSLSEEDRKDKEQRKKMINASDYTFLCLPDVASIEAVSLCENPHTKIIDASTAHRTLHSWAYGLPELSPAHREKIKNSSRVAVPGCYASGFNAICYPLIKGGIMPQYYPTTCTAISGYSGAGKKGIANYEGEDKTEEMLSPRMYALELKHKHVKEMKEISGLSYNPMFMPIVDDYYNGMLVTIPMPIRTIPKRITIERIWEYMSNYYANEKFVTVQKFLGEGTIEKDMLFANTLKGTNKMEIFVCGNEEQALFVARLDNLGKGASGAAVQCMNIMMGIDEATGLE